MTTEVLNTESLQEQVNNLNDMILQGNILEAFEKFYAEDVVMQENEMEPTYGKSACRENEKAFVESITEFRGARVLSVKVMDQITAVEWEFDFTHAQWGVRNYRQLAIQRWNDKGQIINEKFYYSN